ncbi:MAG: helicase [Circoviridae sp.]|nr:MAG: helicase [Circoviridae sp.]
MQSHKSRMFIGTLNNPKHTPEDYLTQWYATGNFAYITGQLEKGKDGTPHVQFYLHAKKPMRITQLKKHCKQSHFEAITINNGADDYCNKEDTRVEGPWSFGIKPARLNKKGDLARRNKELISMGAEKAVEEGIIAIANYPKVKSAIDLYSNCTMTPDHLTTLDNTWIYGKAGIGKTTKALTECGERYYDKDKSKYWNGYTDQKSILIDDIEEDEKFMLGNLKKWA